MESNKMKLQKSIKKYNMLLILIVILMVIIGVCVVKAYEKSKQELPEPVNMISVNTFNKYVSIDVQLLTDPFASNDEQEFCFAADRDNNMYILVLSENDLERLKAIREYTYSEDETSMDTVKIQGITQVIPLDLKKLAIESYNEIYNEGLLNDNNFEEYMGNVYLDTNLSPLDNSGETAIGILCAICAISLLIIYIKMAIITKATLRECELNGTLEEIYTQLDEIDALEYKKGKTFLTREFILDICEGLVIIKYDDIKWIYPFNIKRYGITIKKYIEIVKNDNKKIRILGIDVFGSKKEMEIFNTIYIEICKRVPNAMIGYTEENKNISKNI